MRQRQGQRKAISRYFFHFSLQGGKSPLKRIAQISPTHSHSHVHTYSFAHLLTHTRTVRDKLNWVRGGVSATWGGNRRTQFYQGAKRRDETSTATERTHTHTPIQAHAQARQESSKEKQKYARRQQRHRQRNSPSPQCATHEEEKAAHTALVSAFALRRRCRWLCCLCRCFCLLLLLLFRTILMCASFSRYGRCGWTWIWHMQTWQSETNRQTDGWIGRRRDGQLWTQLFHNLWVRCAVRISCWTCAVFGSPF